MIWQGFVGSQSPAEFMEISRMTQTDTIVARCNGSTMQECVARIWALTTDEAAILFAEYRRRPDGRFGDNLLLALSHHFEVRL